MSLKQNVDYIKEEMQSDEKMLENLLRLESWFKRNKTKLIIIALAIVVVILGYSGNVYYKESKANKLAKIYELALKGDEAALKELKDSKSKLYDLLQFKEAVNNSDTDTLKALQSSQDALISQFATIQNASLNEDGAVLNSENAGDLGYLQAAFLEIKAKNITKAKEILAKIPNDSHVKDVANALEHLTIKGIKDEK